MSKYSVGTIAGLVVAIMLGSIPGFDPLGIIYHTIFGHSLPQYLKYGFSTIGLFTMFYTLIAILIFTPIQCSLGKSFDEIDNVMSSLDKPGKEDLLYIPLLYIVFVITLFVNNSISNESLALGVFAICLPIIYRLIVYKLSDALSNVNRCYYPLYLFLASFVVCIPITVVYLGVMHVLLVMI